MSEHSRRAFLAATGTSLFGAVASGARTDTAANGRTVYVQTRSPEGHEGKLRALDAGTGHWNWETEIGPAPTTPLVVDGTVYTTDGDVAAIDATTGVERWRQPFDDATVTTPPTVIDETVYVGDEDVMALDRRNGRVRWRETVSPGTHRAPTLIEDTMYLVDSRAGIAYAIDARDGSQQWQFDSGETTRVRYTVAGDIVFLSTKRGRLFAIDRTDGTECWEATIDDSLFTVPVVANGLVYIGAGDNAVYAFDAETGDREWLFSTGNSVVVEPTVADGMLYLSSLDGYFYKIDALTGVGDWSVDLAITAAFHVVPTVLDGHVYVTALQVTDRHVGHVAAFDARTGAREWATTIENVRLTPPTVVDDPVDGDSEDSRVMRGTDGHHGGWAARSSAMSFGDAEEPVDGRPAGLAPAATALGVAGAGYLGYRYLGSDRGEED